MPPFHLTVLGPPELRGPNGDPIRLRTRKHLALLVYLTVEQPIHHRRDRLASLFWPKVGIEEARHSLATGLSLLRSKLGTDAFEAGRDTVRLLPGRVSTNLHSIEGGDAANSWSQRIGTFMENFELGALPDFCLWCDLQRAKAIPRLQSLLEARIDASRCRGDLQGMEELADQLHRIDHLNEAAAMATCEARAMAGDRLGALRLFENWQKALADELGARPTRDFERLAACLRRDGLPASRPARSLPDSNRSLVTHPFVGRSDEISACYRVWGHALASRSSHLLIHGDTGIGKSALADRVSSAIALEGGQCVSVHCYSAERHLTYGTVAALIGALVSLPGARATSPEQLTVLACVAPEAARMLLVATEGLTRHSLLPPLHIADALIALIMSVASEHPLVVVIDDVHLSDPPSLSMLHLLMRRLADTPVMFLMTLCDSSAAGRAALQAWASSAGATAATPEHGRR